MTRCKTGPFAAVAASTAIACAALTGCGSDVSSDSAAGNSTSNSTGRQEGALASASFESLPSGWKAFRNADARLAENGAISETYATSWDFDPASGEGPASALPKGGAIVNVLLLRRSRGGGADPSLCAGVAPSRAYPPITRLPLRISDMTVGSLEGAAGVSEYRLLGTLHGDYRVEVRVEVNATRRDAPVLQSAQRALDELRLPRWGNRC
jgi:hypothetical protein